MLTIGREVRTLQLGQYALARRVVICAPAWCIRSRGLLLVAARNAVREDVHLIAVLEKVQGRLQDTDMRLRS